MIDLPTVLRRCREVVAEHHPLSMPDLVAAIDDHLACMAATAVPTPSGPAADGREADR